MLIAVLFCVSNINESLPSAGFAQTIGSLSGDDLHRSNREIESSTSGYTPSS